MLESASQIAYYGESFSAYCFGVAFTNVAGMGHNNLTVKNDLYVIRIENRHVVDDFDRTQR